MPRVLLTLGCLALSAACAHGDEPIREAGAGETWESAAQRLSQATVTVRIWNQEPPAADGPAPSEDDAGPSAVTVCTGVCVGESRIVTVAFAGSDTRIRLTLPGGKQADARLKVIDEYSGLVLLSADTSTLRPLAIADEQPAVGSELLAAAAWGLAQPLVSRGAVGGVDRMHAGGNYPPLLLCDVLTTPTSAGAGLVDRQGRLLGVIVGSEREQAARGWAYAVPAAHVDRILRAGQSQGDDGVVVLKRRRPVVGMVLDQEDEAVVVQRVTPGGPAEKAGIKAGDNILATDGVAIRSVYQAVLPTLYKQPGDVTTFRIQRPDGVHDLRVVLGGGLELKSAPLELLSDLVQPKVEMRREGQRMIVSDPARARTREVFAPPLPADQPPGVPSSSADKIALLEKALERYQAVIEVQQRQLADEQKRRSEQEELIQSLRAEMEALRKSVNTATGK